MRSPELDRPDARLAYLRTRILLQARRDGGAPLDGHAKPLQHARQTHAYYRTLRLLMRIHRLGQRCGSQVLLGTAGRLRQVVREWYRQSPARREFIGSVIIAMAGQDEGRTRRLLDRVEALGHRLHASGLVEAIVIWRQELNEALAHLRVTAVAPADDHNQEQKH